MTLYATPTDVERFGPYRIRREPGDERPLYRFTGRITADGSSGFRAEPGRYHIYAGWFCPWAQRVTIQRELNGLQDIVSVSYVDDSRDARGWGFRETHGPDPVNGFTLLRDAYEATEPGFDGHVSVPTLWDRETGRVVSNDFALTGIDLATQFGEWGNGADTYPERLRPQIEELDSWIGPAVNKGVGAVTGHTRLLEAFGELDTRLAGSRFLLGDDVTEADVRLYVTLVRYDASSNAGGRIGPALPDFGHLWRYARELYDIPAFHDTTRFGSILAPGGDLLDWDAELATHG